MLKKKGYISSIEYLGSQVDRPDHLVVGNKYLGQSQIYFPVYNLGANMGWFIKHSKSYR